jgi:hypothetical protein
MTVTAIETLEASAELASLRAGWDAPFTGEDYDARGAQTRKLAALILAAPLRTRVGELIVDTGGWSRERGLHADSVAERGTPEWIAALGDHEHATLTGDGHAAVRSEWCVCAEEDELGSRPAEQWVRYEYWTARGCEYHGYVHSVCRKLLQVG